jgi:hypothetical protein
MKLYSALEVRKFVKRWFSSLNATDFQHSKEQGFEEDDENEQNKELNKEVQIAFNVQDCRLRLDLIEIRFYYTCIFQTA